MNTQDSCAISKSVTPTYSTKVVSNTTHAYWVAVYTTVSRPSVGEQGSQEGQRVPNS